MRIKIETRKAGFEKKERKKNNKKICMFSIFLLKKGFFLIKLIFCYKNVHIAAVFAPGGGGKKSTFS